ncbi:MAG: ATP-dependent Clp protease ATP-binding subunit [Saprospiraceae bacterium]|nr:ATP-dependent Clp protease ATP-binding subunit [Saprospiraceae bacterium]
MALVRLKIPVLVKNSKVENQTYYHVRPLFTGHPVASHRRLELALARLKDEVRQFFKGFVLERQNADQLLWYLFDPEQDYQLFHYEFHSGDTQVKGDFGITSFMLQGLTFACLPNLHNFMFIAGEGEFHKFELREKTEKVLKRLLPQLKKEQGEDFDMEALYSGNREFITHLDVNINISFGPFQYEILDNSWILTRLREDADFDGSLEIEKVGFDLNSRYPAELGRAFYQDELIEKIYHIIYQEENTPLVIVGDEGVGKHALMHEVVWRYQSGYYNKIKGDPELLWHIDPTRIISGMSIQGMWQKRFEAIISFVRNPLQEVKKSYKILIDNSVALLRIGKSANTNMTLSDVLKPYLEKRQLQLVLIATPEEWKVVQEKDRSFADLFQVIRIAEPAAETSARIVLEQRKLLERAHDCIITIQAIHELFTLQRNFFRNQAMPGSMVRMLRLLATKYRFSKIDSLQVREEFKVLSGLKEQMLDAGEQLDGQAVHNALAQELVGQPRAVAALENVIHLSKAKLVDRSKPVSSFLFIGPTGVGKTQAAKVLCNYLMGSEDQLLRFDMNEYIDGTAVQRLIGDFYNPEGQLTGKVRYRPFGVLLLDEIEKAHPKVHDLLLQLLDEGRLTDSLGRTVDFSNTIIIMTSNLGAREIGLQLGFNPSPESEAGIYRKAVENFFRPEFVNRIDEILIFNPLELDHILNIARLQIRELLQRDGFVRRTTILNISKDALEWVARRGFDARMGGRALKRQIERDLTTLSAEQLVSTNSDSPIIFDITFENNRLNPRIQPLEFLYPIEEEWLPELPDEKHGRAFYGRLLNAVERLEREIATMETDLNEDDGFIVIGGAQRNELNWQYYDYKNKVVEAKDNLRDMMLSFRERYMREAPALPLRLKHGHLVPRRSDRVVREHFRDRLFQEEGLREIRESYQYSTVQFDTIQTDFIHHFLNVVFLLLSARDFLRGRTEEITIRFQSLITGLGHWEIDYLMDQYTTLLKALDIQYEINKENSEIKAEGYSLSQLLQGEVGIHLFYIAHQNPLPILLTLHQHDTIHKNHSSYKVIRIYDGSSTLTDLRTSFANAMNMTSSELKLLVYAGLDEKLRKGLLKY